MKKCTMQDIADELNISRVSVWKVFNNQEGVSESLKKSVYQTAREMGYSKIPEKKAVVKNKTVALVVSRPDSSIFWTSIIHDLSLKLSSMNMTLAYVSIKATYTEGYTLPENFNTANFDGAIILNIYDSILLKMISDVNLPKVYLDTTTDISVDELKGDLLMIEGIDTVKKITDHLIEDRQCKKIGFIGDISYAKTNYDRFCGYRSSLEDHSIALDKKYCLTDNIGIYDYPSTINSFLDSLSKLPDAFVCASDYVVQFVYEYLAMHSDIDRQKIIITGFDGTSEYPNITNKITTAYVDTTSLGIRLAEQIQYRINNPMSPLEVTYMYEKVIFND
jgi:LacI family transcriptional regulator